MSLREMLSDYWGNRLCTWLRFDQHAVGKGFCIGGAAEERAESSVAGFAAVEAKDELIEIGLQMLATQPVVDASRPSFEVGEDLVDPRQDEVSGGLPDDMDIVAIGGDRSVAGPAVGFRDGVGIGGGFDEVSEVRRRRRRRFRGSVASLAKGRCVIRGLPVHLMILRWPDGPVAMPWPRSERTVRDRRRARRSGPRRQCRPGGRTSRPGPCAARASPRSP